MRLIDAKAVEKQIKESFKENPVVMGVLLRWIRKQPTAVDAVPVIRCKDCKHWNCYGGENHNNGDCSELYGMGCCMNGDDFCSYGERKGNG